MCNSYDIKYCFMLLFGIVTLIIILQQEFRRCVCKHGFWGRTCLEICPGGSSTPCYNHGHCNSTTGTCSCDPRWRGDSNCRTCTPGWTGADCTLFKVDKNTTNLRIFTAHAFSLGVLFSLDGLVLFNTLKGPLYLLHNPQIDFFIQARFTPCHKHYLCIDSLGIRYEKTAIAVLAARQESDHVTAYINNKTMTSISYGFTSRESLPCSFTRVSRVRFNFIIGSRLIFSIRAYSGYLDVSCIIQDQSFCFNNSGLWGSCNNNLLDDLHDYNSSIRGNFDNTTDYNSTSDISSVLQSYITSTFLPSWRVSVESDILIARGLNRSAGPFSLRINDTVLKTSEIFTITGLYTSIEIHLRVIQPGIVWTYSNRELFGLIVNKTISIFQGSNIIDTGLSISFLTWYKISITFDSTARLLKIYTVEMNGFFNLRTYTNIFSADTFYPGGVFTIGSTYVPAAGTMNRKAFIGDLFQVTIWNKTLSTNEIRTQVASSISCITKGLANMWRFEQIPSHGLVDCAAYLKMDAMKKVISDQLSWKDANLGIIYNIESSESVFTKTEKLNQIENRCAQIIGAFSKCIYKNRGLSNIFRTLCIRELWIAKQSGFPYHTTAAMKEFCAKAYQENVKDKCQFVESWNREWSGINCSKHCIFGRFDNYDKCICSDGFYGHSCQYECPGGFSKSCYSQGQCDKSSGDCNCLRNFASSSCSSCAANWTTTDCGTALGTSDRYLKRYTCQSFKSNLIGFSASGVRINSVGEYHLLRKAGITIQARYTPCFNESVCLHGIGFSVDGVNLTIYNPNITEKDKSTWLNGEPIKITHAQMISSRLHVSPVSTAVLKVTVYGSEMLNITITFLSADMILTIRSSTCSSIDGLCGSCATYRNNGDRQQATESIVKDIMTKAKVNESYNSLFVYQKPPFYESRVVSDFGYMIHLNDSGISSDEIANLVESNSDFTIEIFVKLFSATGTLISYSHTTTSGIVISDSLKIYKGTEMFDLKIKPKLNVWVRLVFTYDAKLSILSAYQFKSKSDYEVQRIIIKQLDLETIGHLSLGYWQVKKSRPNAEQIAPFRGMIDEVRIWNKLLGQFYLESLHRPRIPHVDGLTAYLNFNEGHGSLFFDCIGRLLMRVPKSIDPLEVWRFSDQTSFPFNHVTRRLGSLHNESLKLEIDTKCSALVYHEDLQERCGKFVGKAFLDYFYLSCIRECYKKKNVEAAYPSVLAYISYCQSITNVNKWPRLRLCDIIPSKYHAAIDATNCVIPCVFGKRDLVNVRCICHSGYWGKDCSNICPGGKSNTCSGKGSCNVTTGACDCQENWKGNFNCSVCTPGWTGDECQLVITPEPPSSACLFAPGGHLVTLNAVHTTFYGHGEFYLLGNSTSTSRVHLHQVPCFDDKSRCTTGIALRTEKHLLTIHAALDDKENPEFAINQKMLHMYGKRHSIDDITILRVEDSLYEIAVANNTRNSLSLMLRNLGREFAITLRAKGTYCSLSNSLCSTCSESDRSLFDLSHAAIENTVRVSSDKLVLSKSDYETTKFRLRFKGVGVSTNVLPSLYYNRDITIELRFTATLTSDQPFTLFSISGSTSFGVIVQGTIKLVVSRTIYDTTYSVEKDKLNQVTLVYNRELRKLTLFFINNNGVVWQYKLDLSPWFTFLEPMDTFVVAEWISGFRDRFFYPANGFQGVVHELRIWKHAYGAVDVRRHFKKTVTAADSDVLSLWKFDEGRGYVVRDLVSGVNLFLPLVASGPQWIRITVDEIAVPVGNDVQFASYIMQQEAVSWCHAQIYSSPLYISCSGLTRPSLR